MVNVAKITAATRELAAWIKASGKTSILETKPTEILNTKNLHYTPKRDYFEGVLADNSLFPLAKKHKLNTSFGNISEDGLALVRLDSDLPQNGFLRTAHDIIKGKYNSKGTRDSLHFSVNHSVEDVPILNGSYTWQDCTYSYILPFKGVKNIVGGCPTDIYTKGSVKIPKGTVIVRQNASVPKGRYRISNSSKIEEFKGLHGVRIVETAEKPYAVTNDILKKLGYEVKQGGIYSWNDIIDRNFIEFLNSKNMFSAIHNNTPNAKIENMIEAIAIRADFKKGWKVLNTKGGLFCDYQKVWASYIDTIEQMAKETGYPLDFDTQTLKKIIQKSKTPQSALTQIRKQLKLTNMSKTKGLFIDENDFIKNVGARVGSSSPISIELDKRAVNFITGHAENSVAEMTKNLENWFMSLQPKT